MGSAMAPAAFDTTCRHFENTGTGFDDYDLIVTGDLSKIGRSMLIDLFKQKGMDPHDKLIDCGLLIYDREHQEVFAGGSRLAACSAVVTIAYLFDLLRTMRCIRSWLSRPRAVINSHRTTEGIDSVHCARGGI